MSSIAYIIESSKIEFHRLNGDTEMNFFRPGKPRNFTDFNEGDLLFFLTKGTRKEKGIVGYGKLKKETRTSVKKMWNEFGRLNGYLSEIELREDLVKMSKGEGLPKQIQNLHLEEVVFFQSPVYLSELGFKLSKKAEGYVYLDKDDKQFTTKILQTAKQHGVDMWAAALHQKEKVFFEEDEMKHCFSTIYKRNKDNLYSSTDLRKAKKLSLDLVNQTKFTYVKGSLLDCIHCQEEEVVLAIPFVFNTKDVKLKAQQLLGHCMMYRLEMKELWKKPLRIKFRILSSTRLPAWLEKNIQTLNEEKNGE